MITHARARRAATLAALVLAPLVTVACGGDVDPAPEQSTTPTGELTPPPTVGVEERVRADIEATFTAAIERLDAFYSSASDYAGAEPGWNIPIVENEMRMRGQAAVDFENSMTAFLMSGIELVGSTRIASFDTGDITLRDDVAAGAATAAACLDQSAASFVNYDGSPADDFVATQSQLWDITLDVRLDIPASEGGGVYITEVAITPNEPC